MITKTYVSAVELANSLGLPLAWLKAEADAGRIPSLRVGRRRLFETSAVRQALAERAEQERGARHD